MRLIRITCIAAFILLPLFSIAQWSEIYSSDTLMDKIYFSDSSTGFVLGYQRVFQTDDGGATWSSFGLDPFFLPLGIHFPSSDTGYIVGHGNGSLVLKTVDGGNNWNELVTGLAPILNDVFFFSNDSGIVVAENNNVIHTADGFQSSQVQSVPEPFTSILSLSFPSRDTGFICGSEGGGGSYIRTFDGGNTWNDGGFATPFKKVFFTSSKEGFLAGGSTIAKTINAGDTWQNKVAGANFYQLYDLFFFGKDAGYAVGNVLSDTSLIIKSIDSGENWFRTNVPDSVGSVTSIFCLSNDHCFACTNSGKILETSNGGGVTGIQHVATNAFGFTLFPNPATTQFTLTTTQPGHLSLTNQLGQTVQTLPIKTQQTTIQVTTLPEGIYLLTFQSDKTTQTQKLIIQH